MYLFTRMEQLWEQDKHYVLRYTLTVSGGLFIHAVLAMLFLICGQTAMVIMNAVSMVFYVGWMAAFTRRPVNAAMLLLIFANLVIHVCVYNLLYGRGGGFFLYAFVVIPMCYYLSFRDIKNMPVLRISTVLSGISVFLMLLTVSFAPKYTLEAGMQEQFFQVNSLMCMLMLSLYTLEFMLSTRHSNENLIYHAETDQLTGLHNRYGIQKEIDRIHGTQYCIVMCDIDDFKKVNDVHGHNVGDAVLSSIGRVLLSSIRQEDIVCRWGGEEFLLMIRGDLDLTRKTVQRIRRKLSTAAVRSGNQEITVTMTFGIADCMEGSEFRDIVAAADSNLLYGKAHGKNCVVISSEQTKLANAANPAPKELDISSLNSGIFTALSLTSDTTYIFICNMNTNVSRWSKSAVEYFGLPSEYMEDAGNIWLGFVHPDDREMYNADISAVFAGKKRLHNVTYQARNKDGEYVICQCRGVMTEGDAENPPFFAGTITNLGIAGAKTGRR